MFTKPSTEKGEVKIKKAYLNFFKYAFGAIDKRKGFNFSEQAISDRPLRQECIAGQAKPYQVG
jgi:hypothetical protein